MNRTISHITLKPHDEFDDDAIMTIAGPDELGINVIEVSDLGQKIEFQGFNAYIVEVISPTEAVLSYRPDNYEKYVDCTAEIVGWEEISVTFADCNFDDALLAHFDAKSREERIQTLKRAAQAEYFLRHSEGFDQTETEVGKTVKLCRDVLLGKGIL